MEKSSGICGKNTNQQTMSNHTSKNLKDLFVGYNYKYKSASTWDHFGNKNDATNYAKGELIGSNAVTSAAFSWPPRSYSCSFCKREFRSAQALGGHMNVHRRDRARLNQSPVRDINNIGQYPLLNLNLDPNPNSSRTLLSSQANSAPHYPKFPHLATLPSISTPKMKNARPLALDFMKMRSGKGLFGVEKLDPCGTTVDVVKKAEFVRLDLKIGMITDQAKYDHDEEEKLDLELRLGYTN